MSAKDYTKVLYDKDKREEELKAEATAAPELKALPTTPNEKYENNKWDESTKGEAALGTYTDAKDAVNKFNEKGFTFTNNDWLQSVLGDIKDFKDFSYDINGDALYQQYKDKYIQQGKLAMMDTMGQAAAMTGGYGNSYAQSVGQQAYQGQLQNLNDIVPELYQMALDKYTMDKQNLYDQYGLLMTEFEREYGLHSDEYNKLLDALGIASDDYYKGAEMFYTEQKNYNDILDKQFANDMAIVTEENDNIWEKAKWDEGIRQYIDGVLYQEGRDAVTDDQWQKNYDAAYGNTAVDDKTKNYSGVTSNGKSYNNGGLTTSQVKALQAALGVEVDGYYGEYSERASGGLSAEEAYAKYVGGDNGGDDKPGGTTSGITDAIRTKAATFDNNEDLAAWAYRLADSGSISEEEADQLIADYMDDNEKYIRNANGTVKSANYREMVKSDKGWSVVDGGGGNLLGIDANARVKTPTGETLRLDQLKEKLIDGGMKPNEATKAIKDLQQKLGISQNWLFGW